MTDQPTGTPPDKPHHINLGAGLRALRDTGLLWELNNILHPAGFELRVTDGDNLLMFGDGRSILRYPPELHDQEAKQRDAYRATINKATQQNYPPYHEGHSAGFGTQRTTSE